MTIQIVPFTTEQAWLDARVGDVTSTEVSALFDACPYLTSYELWHRKKGRLDSVFDPTERTIWGTRLQDAIALGVAADEGWFVRRMDEYIRDPDLRAGASFDWAIGAHVGFADQMCECGHVRAAHIHEEGSCRPGIKCPCPAFRLRAEGLLEIKNVDDRIHRDTWVKGRDEDTGVDYIEAPVHIELQVQHQLMVSERPFAYIAALVGGNRIVLTRRERDEEIIAALRRKIGEFWASIDADEAPVPDFSRDAEVVIRLHQSADGQAIVAPDNVVALAVQHRLLGEQEKAIGEARESLKAEILTLIGDAPKAAWNGGSISASMVGPASYTVNRKGYRLFRVNLAKQKGE